MNDLSAGMRCRGACGHVAGSGDRRRSEMLVAATIHRVIHNPGSHVAESRQDVRMSLRRRTRLARTVLTTGELAAVGVTTQIRRTLVAHGCLVSPARGYYAPAQQGTRCTKARHATQLGAFVELPIDPRTHPRLRARLLRSIALSRRHGTKAIISGVGAAALYGLPVVLDSHAAALPVTELTCPGGRVSHSKGDRQYHLPLRPGDAVIVDGIAVTSMPRTLADVAASHPMTTALAIADDLLRRRVLDLAGVQHALDTHPGRNTDLEVPLATFASGLAESPGESWCRLELHRAGLPAPLEQMVVRDERGRFVARVDFAWPAQGVILEFDGRTKYEKEGGQAVFEEKRREDRLRALGWVVVRCVWADLRRFDSVATELRHALDRDLMRLRGMALDAHGTRIIAPVPAARPSAPTKR